jgi:hypothetical protein
MCEKVFNAMDKSGDDKLSYAEVEGFVLMVAGKRSSIAE